MTSLPLDGNFNRY